MGCLICNRPSRKPLCSRHALACRKVVKQFPIWAKSLEVSWFSYLAAVVDRSETGEWAKEVSRYLLDKLIDLDEATRLAGCH